MQNLVPYLKDLPFFKERGLNEAAMTETLNLMTLKELKKDEFVIEYGSFGDEFYVIIDGECEVLIPERNGAALKEIDFKIKVLSESLEENLSEVDSFMAYGKQVSMRKQKQLDREMILIGNAERKGTLANIPIPEAVKAREDIIIDLI